MGPDLIDPDICIFRKVLRALERRKKLQAFFRKGRQGIIWVHWIGNFASGLIALAAIVKLIFGGP
jgi:hypothetical protein